MTRPPSAHRPSELPKAKYDTTTREYTLYCVLPVPGGRVGQQFIWFCFETRAARSLPGFEFGEEISIQLYYL